MDRPTRHTNPSLLPGSLRIINVVIVIIRAETIVSAGFYAFYQIYNLGVELIL